MSNQTSILLLAVLLTGTSACNNESSTGTSAYDSTQLAQPADNTGVNGDVMSDTGRSGTNGSMSGGAISGGNDAAPGQSRNSGNNNNQATETQSRPTNINRQENRTGHPGADTINNRSGLAPVR